MTRRRLSWISIAMAVAALSALTSFWISRATRAEGRAWIPFTAVMAEKQYQAGATAPVHNWNYIYAVRSDGCWVKDSKRRLLPNGEWVDMRIVMNYSTGARVSIDPLTESVTTYHSARKWIDQLSTPPVACSNDPSSKHGVFLGYDTLVVEHASPLPEGPRLLNGGRPS